MAAVFIVHMVATTDRGYENGRPISIRIVGPVQSLRDAEIG